MEDERNDIKKLIEDDLLTLYYNVKDHLDYLEQQVIEPHAKEQATEENGGDIDE